MIRADRTVRSIAVWSFLIMVAAALGTVAAHGRETYTVADFERVRKFDAHVHANTDDRAFLKIARKDGFEILSINVDYPDFPPLSAQAQVAHNLQAVDPRHFHFATTFSMTGFGSDRWTQESIRAIDSEIQRGALGVKVWKNIGMVEKDPQGRFIMLDDPGFDAVMRHIEALRVPLIAHQAEPKNCWLPLEAMTTDNDRSYFRDHPEYHMYLHPEQPSYESLIAARDHFVARHPRLKFVGAHMGSLEWSVDALSKFLDTYPNATVDLAARMTQVQYQSKSGYDKVRRFFIAYQDRILYGSDLTENPPDTAERAQNPPIDAAEFPKEADAFWRSDWTYLATTSVQHVDAIEADVQGLALPKRVVDKIYYGNARRVFALPREPAATADPAATERISHRTNLPSR
ncbi:MAG TPA: amidohydrolase family protein [Steroidobacteraceae bacterium]|nr:amidohydrolase family protein [Steroidobacteraceae bacterium]